MSHLLESDLISYKLLDLNDNENRKNVDIGDFFWLQITDRIDEDIRSDKNIQSHRGRLLGSKVSGPPVLGRSLSLYLLSSLIRLY